MSKNSKRNRHTGVINAFKQDIIRTGDERQFNGRVYYSKVLKNRALKDAQGNVTALIPCRTIVRAV